MKRFIAVFAFLLVFSLHAGIPARRTTVFTFFERGGRVFVKQSFGNMQRLYVTPVRAK